MNDITPEMKNVLDFIDGKRAADDYTKALEQEIESVRKNEKWRLDYMTLQMKYQEKYEQGMEQGIEKGMEQGIEKGIEQGIEQGKRQMATFICHMGTHIRSNAYRLHRIIHIGSCFVCKR